ncbi:hypothetical protein ACH5RR_023739 [Cinchona calisaya]|uniref:Uncharacterized protein n=1 Tax=Cinchona calisaya TaxID=153742 RepID=A0ABD2ZBH5_9GENT
MSCFAVLFRGAYNVVRGYFWRGTSYEELTNFGLFPANVPHHLLKVYLLQASVVAYMLYGFESCNFFTIGAGELFAGSLAICWFIAPERWVCSGSICAILTFYVGIYTQFLVARGASVLYFVQDALTFFVDSPAILGNCFYVLLSRLVPIRADRMPPQLELV